MAGKTHQKRKSGRKAEKRKTAEKKKKGEDVEVSGAWGALSRKLPLAGISAGVGC